MTRTNNTTDSSGAATPPPVDGMVQFSVMGGSGPRKNYDSTVEVLYQALTSYRRDLETIKRDYWKAGDSVTDCEQLDAQTTTLDEMLTEVFFCMVDNLKANS